MDYLKAVVVESRFDEVPKGSPMGTFLDTLRTINGSSTIRGSERIYGAIDMGKAWFSHNCYSGAVETLTTLETELRRGKSVKVERISR